jgi:uncharacterized repeat protein (TIGR02543 family)
MKNRTKLFGTHGHRLLSSLYAASIVMAMVVSLAVLIFTGCPNSEDTKPPEDTTPKTTPVTFTNLTADGSATATTTKLTLTFDKDITGLSAADINLTAGSTGAAKGTLTKTGTGVYELTLTGITAGGSVTVEVSKSGYNITGGSKTVTVYRYTAPSNTYTVNYNANGGTGTMEPSTFTRGTAQALRPNTFTRSDYVFSGWATTAGGAAVYTDGQTVTDLAAAGGSVTLYAIWQAGTLVPGSSLGAKLNWLETNAGSDMRYIIEVQETDTISPRTLSYSGKRNITIRLMGAGGMKTIGLVSNGSLFTVDSGVTLILDNNITLQGRNNNNYVLVRVNDGGTLIMNSGTKITGNNGAGVYVRGGAFNMSGGEISGNHGGGVDVSGTFNMSGGTISGNTTIVDTTYYDGGGGGVYVRGGGAFNKTGGTITGYASDTVNGNVVKDSSGVVLNNQGHAVYVYVSETAPAKRRETTAGPGVNLNSAVTGSQGGWE